MRARYAKAQPRSLTGMNSTESQFHLWLKTRQEKGEISDVKFEGITLKLGDDCRYTPDFSYVAEDGVLELVEVKAGQVKAKIVGGKLRTTAKTLMTEAGRLRLHVAAEMFPFRFRLATLAGGRWIVEDV